MAQVERGENAAGFGKVRSGSFERELALFERGRNGIVRQAKQQGTFFAREFALIDLRASGGRRRIMR
jgi:hypothetical protein